MTLLSVFSLCFGSVICKHYGMLLTDCCPVREERAFLMVSLVPNTNSKTVGVFIYCSYYLQNIPTFSQLDVEFVDKGMVTMCSFRPEISLHFFFLEPRCRWPRESPVF